VSVPAEACT